MEFFNQLETDLTKGNFKLTSKTTSNELAKCVYSKSLKEKHLFCCILR